MNFGRVFAFLALIVFSAHAVLEAKDQPAEDQLRGRVTAFWDAWSKNDVKKLEEMVRKENRPSFAAQPRYQLFDFKLDSIVMSNDSRSAFVKTRLKRSFPMRNKPVDWIQEDHWVFEKHKWYLDMSPPNQSAGLFGVSGPQKSLAQKDVGEVNSEKEGGRSSTPGPVVFDRTVYDFGNVAGGDPLEYVFNFENRGQNPVRVTRVVASCLQQANEGPCLSARSNASVFFPGTKGRVEAIWTYTSKPQKVDQTIEVDFDNGQVFFLHFVATITEPAKPSS